MSLFLLRWIHVINDIFSCVKFIIYFITDQRSDACCWVLWGFCCFFVCVLTTTVFIRKPGHISVFLSLWFCSFLFLHWNDLWCSSLWMMGTFIFTHSDVTVKDGTIYDNDSETRRTVTSSFTLLHHQQTEVNPQEGRSATQEVNATFHFLLRNEAEKRKEKEEQWMKSNGLKCLYFCCWFRLQVRINPLLRCSQFE